MCAEHYVAASVILNHNQYAGDVCRNNAFQIDALGRARRILTGELTEVEAYAELDEKFPQQ